MGLLQHFLEQLALEEENPVFENTGLCHNPLCEIEELPSEMIGMQCDCGGYIWHQDEYTKPAQCCKCKSLDGDLYSDWYNAIYCADCLSPADHLYGGMKPIVVSQ